MIGSKNKNNEGKQRLRELHSAIEYEQQLRKSGFRQNPVIVIPGILGSNIANLENENTLWGDFGKSFADPGKDENLRMIALPMQYGKTLDQLKGQSTADGSLRYVKSSVAGVPIKINTYASMLTAMGVGVAGSGSTLQRLDDYVDDYRNETNAFEFGYDWRRSMDENACLLDDYIRQVSRFVQLQRGNHDPVKFDIVAHSMGGLIVRYYLQYGAQLLPEGDAKPVPNWSGSAQIDKVILIGTPNGGSLFALESLIVGVPKNPVTPSYDPVVLGTLPAVYQLLPRYRYKTFVRTDSSERHSDFMDPDLWIAMGWGLANTGKDPILRRLLPGIESAERRRDVALEHLEKCLRVCAKLHQSLDAVSHQPQHLKMFLFIGDTTPTPLVAAAKQGDQKLSFVKKGAGDGTVPRSSVLLDERVVGKWEPKVVSPLKWDNVVFLSSSHLGLTKDPLCIKNILYILLERP